MIPPKPTQSATFEKTIETTQLTKQPTTVLIASLLILEFITLVCAGFFAFKYLGLKKENIAPKEEGVLVEKQNTTPQSTASPTISVEQFEQIESGVILSSKKYEAQLRSYMENIKKKYRDNAVNEQLITKAVEEYNTVDSFTKWTLSICPNTFTVGKAGGRQPISEKIELQFDTNDIGGIGCIGNPVSPSFSYFDIDISNQNFGRKMLFASFFILGKSANAGGLDGVNGEQVLEKINTLPKVQDISIEILSEKEFNQDTGAPAGYTIRIYAYKVFPEFIVAGNVVFSENDTSLTEKADVSTYSDIVDRLVGLVSKVEVVQK